MLSIASFINKLALRGSRISTLQFSIFHQATFKVFDSDVVGTFDMPDRMTNYPPHVTQS